jgi:hypothetical protein
MANPIRHKSGVLMQPGTGGHELALAGKHKELDKHMDELDKTWRKMEGRKPVSELTPRELMLEGRLPWNPAMLKESNGVHHGSTI